MTPVTSRTYSLPPPAALRVLVFAAFLLVSFASAARHQARHPRGRSGDDAGRIALLPADKGPSSEYYACAQHSLDPTRSRSVKNLRLRAGSLMDAQGSLLPSSLHVENGHFFNSYRSKETFLVSSSGPAPEAGRPLRISLAQSGQADPGPVAVAGFPLFHHGQKGKSGKENLVASGEANPPAERPTATTALAAKRATIVFAACGFGFVTVEAFNANAEPLARKSLPVAFACGTSIARALAWSEKSVASLSALKDGHGRISSVNVFFDSDPAAADEIKDVGSTKGAVAVVKVDFDC